MMFSFANGVNGVRLGRTKVVPILSACYRFFPLSNCLIRIGDADVESIDFI